MKKVMLLFVFTYLILFSACNPIKAEECNEKEIGVNGNLFDETIQHTTDSIEDNIPSTKNDTVAFESGTFFNKNWHDVIGTYKEAVVPNKETAIQIAKAIFDGMPKNKNTINYIPQIVFYDEQDEVWVVTFWEKNSTTTVGGDCSIAIQKEDGAVLRIWYGE